MAGNLDGGKCAQLYCIRQHLYKYKMLQFFNLVTFLPVILFYGSDIFVKCKAFESKWIVCPMQTHILIGTLFKPEQLLAWRSRAETITLLY